MKHFFSMLRGWPVALLILLWLAGPAVWAQAPAWQMAITANHANYYTSAVNAIATDASGNVYLAGEFGGNITFGSTTLYGGNTGDRDVFVAKWSSLSRTFVWALRAGGIGHDIARKIAVVGNSIYLTGTVSSSAPAFGSIILGGAMGSSDIFVAKLTDTGNAGSFVWAQRMGSGSTDEVRSLAVSGTSLYIAGTIATAGNFGTVILPNTGNDQLFVAKLTDTGTTGTVNWAAGVESTSGCSGSAVVVNGTNVYIAGSFLGTMSLGNQYFNSINGGSFVAKLTDQGTSASLVWAKQGAGAATGLALNGPTIYLLGSFAGQTVIIGNSTLTNTSPNGYTVDVYVAKIVDAGNTGNFVWAVSAGGVRNDNAQAILAVGNNVCLTGAFDNVTATFGSTTLTNVSSGPFTVSGDYSDIYVAKVADTGLTGSFVWAQQAGSTAADRGNAIAINGTTLYVGGYVFPQSNCQFGTIALTTPNTNVGFLASLTDPTLTATAATQGTLSFTLAPNPARTSATVQLPAVPGTATATLTLRDALGRAVRTATVSLPAAGLRHELDLRGLAPGLYAVQVRAGSTRGTQRLVVE